MRRSATENRGFLHMAKRDKTPADALPAILIEAEAVDTIAGWIDHWSRGRLGIGGGPARVLRASTVREAPSMGAVSRMQVIAAAKAGRSGRGAACCATSPWSASASKVDLPPELAEYNAVGSWRQFRGAAFRRRAGRSATTWLRDVGIAVLAALAQRRWPAGAEDDGSRHQQEGRGTGCRSAC